MTVNLNPLSKKGFGSNAPFNIGMTITAADIQLEGGDSKNIFKYYKDAKGTIVFEEKLSPGSKPLKNETLSVEEQALEGSLDFYNHMHRVHQTAFFRGDHVEKSTHVEHSPPTNGGYYYSPRTCFYYDETLTGRTGDIKFKQTTSRVYETNVISSMEYEGQDKEGNITQVKQRWDYNTREQKQLEQKFNGALHGLQQDKEGNTSYFWHGKPVNPLQYTFNNMCENGISALFTDRNEPAQKAEKRLPEKAHESPRFWNKRPMPNY